MAGTKDKAAQEKKAVLPEKSNFSEWYNELLLMAEIMDVRILLRALCLVPVRFDVRKRTYAIIRELLDKDIRKRFFPAYPRERVHEGGRTYKRL